MLSLDDHLFAGLFAGSLSTAILHPIDLVKVRYQVYEGQGGPYGSILIAFRKIFQKEGVGGLYQGLLPAVLASAVSWGGYFYFYESFKKSMLEHRQIYGWGAKLYPIDHMISGIGAGCVMVLLTNPFWLAKTRLQLQGTYSSIQPHINGNFVTSNASTNNHSQIKYQGLTDTLLSILREEGVTGLYKGLIPSLLLTANGAIQFTIYESLKDFSRGLPKYGQPEAKKDQTALESIVMGGGSKILATLITYPYQVVKSRLQQRVRLGTVIDSGQNDARTSGNSISSSNVVLSPYKGTVDCLATMWRNEGVRGLFRGIVPHCLRVAPSASLTLLIYEESLKLLKNR